MSTTQRLLLLGAACAVASGGSLRHKPPYKTIDVGATPEEGCRLLEGNYVPVTSCEHPLLPLSLLRQPTRARRPAYTRSHRHLRVLPHSSDPTFRVRARPTCRRGVTASCCSCAASSVRHPHQIDMCTLRRCGLRSSPDHVRQELALEAAGVRRGWLQHAAPPGLHPTLQLWPLQPLPDVQQSQLWCLRDELRLHRRRRSP